MAIQLHTPITEAQVRSLKVGDAVEITTFHAAKGLEWPIVHLAGLEQGLVPISYARTRDALETALENGTEAETGEGTE